MKKVIVLLIITFFMGVCVFAEDDLEVRLKELQRKTKEGQAPMVDSSLSNSIREFLMKNLDVSLKDFKRIRVAYYASRIVYEELSKKYNANPQNYQEMIKNNTDQNIYKITMDIQKKYNLRGYFLCKRNEVEAMESYQKVRKLIKEGPRDRYSDAWVNIDEEILKECKYDTSAIYSLLSEYRAKNYREKFNNLMLRILKEDQVDYDYLYYPIDKVNTNLIIQYLFFFTHINPLRENLIFTKEQVKFIAEDMMTKHTELLNFKNEYYVRRDNSVDEYHMRDAINALICVSTWLREYKLNELNDKLLERYFNDELVLNTMRYDPQFKDFMEYLQKWREAKEKAEKEKKDAIKTP